MKGIVLAGGSGTRLFPLTNTTSKQLLPIYDKPMIYYPISVLMQAGIKDILIISTPRDLPNCKTLLGDGKQFGINLEYKVQPSPDGIAQAFILGEEFIGEDGCALILGDNIFYGENFDNALKEAAYNCEINHKTTIFGYYVNDPERFGVVEFDKDNKVISIEEKPKNPKSNYAVTGLYFYDKKCVEYAKQLKPSARGELEITDLNNLYLKNDNLNVNLLESKFFWIDAGTTDSLLEAGNFVQSVEKQQKIKISVLEEIAFKNGWITKEELMALTERCGKSNYGKYLKEVAEGRI